MTVAGTNYRAKLSVVLAGLVIAGMGVIAIREAAAQGTTTTGTTTPQNQNNITISPTINVTGNGSSNGAGTGTGPFGGFFGNSVVGGVSVNVDGVLKHQDATQRDQLLEARRKALEGTTGELNQAAKLRMVSLRKLDKAIAQCAKSGKQLPDDMRYLAGLQRVQYIFVFPEQHDVVLAGPADGWKVNEQGEVVGSTTGRPVLQLDDLIVALRCADAARHGGVNVSIDPTPEGMQRLNTLLAQQPVVNNNIEKIAGAMEEALGPQNISLHGVPDTSRFANVLVLADYQMKRLGMNLDHSPVKGLTSYLEMVSPTARTVQTPRWWLAPKYDPLATDGEGLAWEIRGQGVQCMAEEDYFAANGQRQVNAKPNPLAQKWADSMTSHFEELAQKDSIFGDLRNCIDLAVAGALVQKENLLEKVGFQPQYLLNDKLLIATGYNPPKQVDSKVSLLKKGSNYVISVSGGVALQPWEIIQKQQKTPDLTPVRTAAAQGRSMTDLVHAGRWWWDG
ncbi:MAG TPA: DUF1598 domain-containing protein [Pirellulales bacterium]|jgi:hypothetical protein|nr:DUF1598 domain-containing protein [Pirellulales bacterium]